jgi:hypothetical protein
VNHKTALIAGLILSLLVGCSNRAAEATFDARIQNPSSITSAKILGYDGTRTLTSNEINQLVTSFRKENRKGAGLWGKSEVIAAMRFEGTNQFYVNLMRDGIFETQDYTFILKDTNMIRFLPEWEAAHKSETK